MQSIKPLKKFGQNYLTDKNIIRKIINEISPIKDDNLIEIGPGTGSLTEELLEKVPQIIAVEIDKRANKILLTKFPNLNLAEEDFLKFDLRNIYEKKRKRLRIIGNIPYNLTSSIMFKLIDNNQIIEDAVLMVQFEVAKRMISKAGTKDYGILAVLVQYFCDVRLCFKISPNVFFPKPKVYSAIIHLFFKSDVLEDGKKKLFIQIVKASFGKRRKTLKNSLSNSIFEKLNFENCGIDLSLRAEQLSIREFLILTDFAYKKVDY
jgi:16S rRNA (adenine1518-N6/adenine1519-N6)-dimethyltransferase